MKRPNVVSFAGKCRHLPRCHFIRSAVVGFVVTVLCALSLSCGAITATLFRRLQQGQSLALLSSSQSHGRTLQYIRNDSQLQDIGQGTIYPTTAKMQSHWFLSRMKRKHRSRKPLVMIGVLMMDSPQATMQRNLLRIAFQTSRILLRFVICRPTTATLQEGDVVPIDMEENINEGKTRMWFAYAYKHKPKSVRAIFKLDTDVLFCPEKLLDTVQKTANTPFAFYGTFMNHLACSPTGFVHCPPPHCNENNTFLGDCWYYMSGGFYGFSTELLNEVVRTPLFQQRWHESHHEDIMSARWVNTTSCRSKVREINFQYHHHKNLIHINPPTYGNHVVRYAEVLSSFGCKREAETVSKHLQALYGATPWKDTLMNSSSTS